jgi:hypothetical protein
MSGYHYFENSGNTNAMGCKSNCFEQTSYDNLAQTKQGSCAPHCLDRYSRERSSKDKWMLQAFFSGGNYFPPYPILRTMRINNRS